MKQEVDNETLELELIATNESPIVEVKTNLLEQQDSILVADINENFVMLNDFLGKGITWYQRIHIVFIDIWNYLINFLVFK